MKILIIEDEPLILRSLEKLLSRKGHQVETSTSGRRAIDLINKESYERIICDLMLQDITGFDIIEESKIRYSKEEISKIFIIITAYSSPQVLEKASVYNCEIIKKPFDDLNEALEIMSTPK